MALELEPLIDLARLRDALDRLTGDAVKLGVWLASTEPPERADAAWAKAVSGQIGVAEKIVRKTVKELSDEGLVTLCGRINLSRTSDGGHSLARRRGREGVDGQDGRDGQEEEKPPWERKRGEPRSGEAKGKEGNAEDEHGARGLNGEVRSPKLFCSLCGDLAHAEPLGPCVRGHTLPPMASAYKCVVDAIDRMWRDCYSSGDPSVRPKWGGRQGKIVKDLLVSHEPKEIIRRAHIMFYESRAWPKPPHDVFTLHTHFDKFAVAKAQGGMVGDPRRTGAAYYGEVTDG